MSRQQRERALRDEAIRWRQRLQHRGPVALDQDEVRALELFLHRVWPGVPVGRAVAAVHM